MKDICTQLGLMPGETLTTAQKELYDWLVDFIGDQHHSPSIRQMMQAMGLKSPAPIQSRLRHLQEKGWIKWQEGQARTLQLLEESISGVPVLGAIAAGGLVAGLKAGYAYNTFPLMNGKLLPPNFFSDTSL